MVEKFLEQTTFTSQEDFIKNLKIKIPENFNFGYDIVDAWAAEEPDKKALLWTNDKGEHIQYTYADLKKYTDMTASYFQSLGIGHGDMVMLILKRRYEFWYSIIALHKLGAVVIPATHLLTKKDIVYRCNAADIKMIVAAGEDVITKHIIDAMPDCPSVKKLVSVGPDIPEGFEDFHKGIEKAAPFVKPEHPNTNEDTSLMYFTSGTTGEPKMVAHDFTYPLGHIVTASFWHNLHRDSLHLTIADTGWGKAVWGKLYGQMIAGANIFVYDHEKFTPADILGKIQDYHITSLCAPPTIYRFLIKEDISKYDLSSLEYCTTAGEALNYSVYETFKKITGIRLMEGFGQTETTLTLGTFPWMEPKPGSMGVPNPQYDIDLLTHDGRSAEDGEQGQIVIRTDRGKPLGCSLGDHGGRSRPRGDDPRLDRGSECGMVFSYGCGGISPRLDGRGVQILPPGGVDGSRQCGIPAGGRTDGKSGERPVCGRTRRWNEHARLRRVLPVHGADGRLRRLRAVYLLLLITF